MNNELRLTCQELNERGQGVGYLSDGRALFASDWLPGERALLQVQRTTACYLQAEVVERLTSHSSRAEPPCPLFFSCGGCHLQHLKYPAQLELKEQRLRRLWEDRELPLYPIVYSREHAYRHKLLLPLRYRKGQIEVGFFSPGTQQLVAISSSAQAGPSCWVQTPALQLLLRLSAPLARQMQLQVPLADGSWPQKEPVLRYLFARESYAYGQIHLTLGVTADSPKWKQYSVALADQLQKQMGRDLITGASLVLHPESDNRWLQGQRLALWGDLYLQEQILGMRWHYDPCSFFQVNPGLIGSIWQQIRRWLQERGIDRLLELYCGSGWLANWLASQGVKVEGIERDPQAVKVARELAEHRDTGASFEVWDLDAALYPCQTLWPALLVNPPRRGLSRSCLELVAQLQPTALIYMACGQESLLRDADLLNACGYELLELRPFDLFPQTIHLETLALFRRRDL